MLDEKLMFFYTYKYNHILWAFCCNFHIICMYIDIESNGILMVDNLCVDSHVKSQFNPNVMFDQCYHYEYLKFPVYLNFPYF